MARITDQSRVERLKEATMKLVAEKGFGGASALLIANHAKVSMGYFYRHYKSKEEMVNALLSEVFIEIAGNIEDLIKKGSRFNEIIKSLVHFFIELANSDPIKIKFFSVLFNDYRFKMEASSKEQVLGYIQRIMEMGQKENELDAKLSADDLFLILVVNTLQTINQRFKYSNLPVIFYENDEEHMLYIITKTIK